MLRSRKIALIAATVLLTLGLMALVYFTFVSPPEEIRRSGARFVLREGTYGG